MKRFISMILVVMMIFTLIPINSNNIYAYEDTGGNDGFIMSPSTQGKL